MSDISKLSNKLSSNITSYDLLKTFAVIIMVVDHMGYYFFPEELWFRAVGRLCVPAWFFLIGYAGVRGVPVKWYIGGLVLVIANFIVGMPVMPLNILFTMAFARIFLYVFANNFLGKNLYLYCILAAMFGFVLPSGIVYEYGTLSFIAVLYGYFVRNKQNINDDSFITKYMIFYILAFVIYQQITFGFTPVQFQFMFIGVLVVSFWLLYFDSHNYPLLTQKTPKAITWFIQLCGRRTLEIYVIHLTLFKILTLYLGYDGYGLFKFKLVDLSMFDMSVQPEI